MRAFECTSETMDDYVSVAELVQEESSVVSDEHLLEAYKKGDICILKLLLGHWTSDPDVLLFNCIQDGNTRVLAALLEHPKTVLKEGVVILACSLGKPEIIALILRDKRFDPTEIANTCIGKLIASNSMTGLITFLSDSRLAHHLGDTLHILVGRALPCEGSDAHEPSISIFEGLISALPYSSVELALSCISNKRLFSAVLRCMKTEHKKDMLENCVRPPSDIGLLRLIATDATSAVTRHLLSLGIHYQERAVIDLALERHQAVKCDSNHGTCPLLNAIESKSEEICLLIGQHRELVDCPHLNAVTWTACELGYVEYLNQLLPVLIGRRDWNSNDSTAHIICSLLSSNHESKVLALLDSGYVVEHLTLVRCLRRGYHTTVRTICGKQDVDLTHNNYELLRAAALLMGPAAFDSLLLVNSSLGSRFLKSRTPR